MGGRRTSRCHPARKARLARHLLDADSERPIWRTTPSSSCCSSNARRAERLARIALLRRANSAAGILRPARRHARWRPPSRSFARLVAHAGLPARAGIEHPIDLGLGCRPACRAPWLHRWPSARGDGTDTRHALLIVFERTRRARRRDVECLARQPVARSGAARNRSRCGMGALHKRTRAAPRRHAANLFAGVPSVRSSTGGRASADLRRALGRAARGGVSAWPGRVSSRARDHPLLCAARAGCQPIVARRRHRVGAAPARRPQQMRSGQPRPLAAVRRVAHRRVPRPLPHVCRVAQPRAQLASDLPRELHRRVAARARGASRQSAGSVGSAAGDRAARAQRLSRGQPRRAAVQRPAVFSRALAHRRIVRRRRRGRAAGAACRCRQQQADTRGSARASTIATSASSSSARCTKACSITSPPMQTRDETRFCFGAAATRASRPARSTRRRRSPTTSCGARCIRWSTERRPIAFFSLRVVDPAMGSAAFLVSACRYLARAYERALVRDGWPTPPISTKRTARSFRRLVAQRCLFGVDLNPTAVQLARLSLWLATLSANKPLTFLDHHLVCGNSLIGASPIDIARQPPGARLAAAARIACRHAALLRRRSRAFARARRRRAPLAGRHARRHRRCRPGKRTPARCDCARASDGSRSPISGARAGCGRTRTRRRTRRYSHRSQTN